MFRTTGNTGFHIVFDNGIKLSTQFAGGNYCENYDMEIGRKGDHESKNAEIAIFDMRGNFITKDVLTDLYGASHCDDVVGHVELFTWIEIVNYLYNLSCEAD